MRMQRFASASMQCFACHRLLEKGKAMTAYIAAPPDGKNEVH